MKSRRRIPPPSLRALILAVRTKLVKGCRCPLWVKSTVDVRFGSIADIAANTA